MELDARSGCGVRRRMHNGQAVFMLRSASPRAERMFSRVTLGRVVVVTARRLLLECADAESNGHGRVLPKIPH